MDEELMRLAVHGTLHVLGYDHPNGPAVRAAPCGASRRVRSAPARSAQLMVTATAVQLGGAILALGAALWAALLALGEEVAVGEALHTLGDAPPSAPGARVPLHRALHVARLAMLVLGAVAAGHALGWWQQPWPTALADLGLATALLFVVGDALPRTLVRLAPELGEAALPVARRTLAPFNLLLWLLAWVDRALHALVDAPPLLAPPLGIAQRDMLLGVFTLADTTVEEVMTPRLDIVAVDIAASTETLLETFRTSEHSRLPVYDGTADAIIGIMLAKDVVPVAMGMSHTDGRWQDLVRPAAFIPETKTLDHQLRDFQRGPVHCAIVVDEFGGTAGLITLEDILEEVVGEIRDEQDVDVPRDSAGGQPLLGGRT